MRGTSARLDRRVNAVRDDLADIALADRVVAPRYAAPVAMRGVAAVAPLHAAPNASATVVSELLYGERFDVFDRSGGWAWGQCAADAYVGWVRTDALTDGGAAPTVILRVPQALVFAEASIKSAVIATLPMGSRLAVTPHDADFSCAAGGFIHSRHLAAPVGDPVDLAFAFIGTPYRWGGRSRDGIDCSGLVQAVLGAHGVACPRDSDQQAAAFPVVPFAARRRGDIVAFPGHVGMLADPDRLIHANAFHMSTVIEPLADVVARLQLLHAEPVSAVVRPPCEGSGLSL